MYSNEKRDRRKSGTRGFNPRQITHETKKKNTTRKRENQKRGPRRVQKQETTTASGKSNDV